MQIFSFFRWYSKMQHKINSQLIMINLIAGMEFQNADILFSRTIVTKVGTYWHKSRKFMTSYM